MTPDQFIAAHRAALIDSMLGTTDKTAETPPDQVRQFVVGFASVLEAAASGDVGPRDDYLEGVIPAIRDSGMPLTFVMEGMVRVSVGAAAVLGPERAEWLANFCSDYTRRLLEIWQSR